MSRFTTRPVILTDPAFSRTHRRRDETDIKRGERFYEKIADAVYQSNPDGKSILITVYCNDQGDVFALPKVIFDQTFMELMT